MPNALQHETSPYLLQHANNPVDWMPWGDAALAKAKSENKLLLISIGYAACHWCHVMERESFERDDVAAVMNANFVCIKVDREERPDVDDVYMLACQLSGGGGCGWPLNSVALPDGRPVWAGTYFPRERWIELLNNFTTIRQQEPERLEAYARQIGEQLQVAAPIQILDVQPFGAAFLDRAAKSIVNLSDPRWGGFGGAPKFPLPIGYAFLLDYLANSVGDEGLRASVAAVTQQGLLALARGGIYDQLGGGWSRYAVDIRWHVPHFEKMLYDNAQLLSVFARAFRQNPLAEYAAVLHETVGFLARELRAEPGFFYSSLDADSEGEEGKFYVWTDAELSGLLSAKELALTQEIYALRPGGNWEDGKHILHRPEGWQALDTNTGKIDVNMEATAAERTSLLASLRAKLFAARSQRVRPALDDKILVSWNGLLISGLVDVHLALGQASPALGMAERAAHALVATFLQPDGRLLRTHAKGRTHINAFLDDYANFGQGLLDLYSVTFDEHWLRLAERLVDYALTHFCEDGRPLLFYTSDLDQQLVARRLEKHDNVMPSSNSVMAGLLFSLGHTLGRYQWVERAEDMLREVEPEIRKARQSLYWSRWMQVYLRLSRPHFEVAIVGPEALSLRQAFAKTSFPTVTFLGSLENSQLNTLEGKYLEGQTWIYVCQRGSCQEPTQVLAKALDQIHESTIK